MKGFYLMILALLLMLLILIASCAENKLTISSSDIEKAGVKETFIRTTKLEINASDECQESAQESQPYIGIITPKDREIIHNNTIFVKLSISNFKLVSPNRYPKYGQGHVQVWVDDMEFRGTKTEFIFTNESDGMHIIKAELMLSNNTVLPYSKTIRVFVNKT